MKQKIKKLAHQLWTDESGQGTAEYALIIVAVVGLAILFKGRIRTALDTFMGKIDTGMGGFGTDGGTT